MGGFMELVNANNNILFDGDAMKSLFNNCAALAKIPFLKPDLRGKHEAILAIVLMARELNIPPMTALSSMHFIQGVPTLPTATMLALARTRVPKLWINWELDHKNKTVKCEGRRSVDDDATYTSIWDMDRAKQMNLLGRDQYIKQPLNMLKWRATAEVLRVIAPEAIQGIYGWEEFRKLDGSEIEPTLEQKLNQDLQEAIDASIPEHEKVCGNEYRIQNGTYRGTQFKDMDRPEFDEFMEYLEKQLKSKSARPWHDELHAVASQYLMEWDHHRALLEE